MSLTIRDVESNCDLCYPCGEHRAERAMGSARVQTRSGQDWVVADAISIYSPALSNSLRDKRSLQLLQRLGYERGGTRCVQYGG